MTTFNQRREVIISKCINLNQFLKSFNSWYLQQKRLSYKEYLYAVKWDIIPYSFHCMHGFVRLTK